MNIISVVTPSYQPRPEHLRAAYDSLCEQEMPAGWDWEWAIQEDGTTGVIADMLPADPRVNLSMGRRGGIAQTRNLAMARARGTLIKNLDSDDILAPGVLARDITVLTDQPDIGWTTSRVLDLLPDGSTVGFDDPPSGRLEPGTVVIHWRSHNYRLPVHPTTVCIRRTLAVALGGWMAVPGSEDAGLLIAASTISAGYFHQEVGLLYRKWPGQVTAAPAHTERSEWQLRMAFIDERAQALAALWPAADLEDHASLA